MTATTATNSANAVDVSFVNAQSTDFDISKNKDGGVMKTIIKAGVSDSHPKAGDTVYVHYVGTLVDGTKFDSSRDRGEKFSFTLGRGQVISAWDTAVATMTKGEICRIHCASKYAYGSSGSPPKIPADADLIFEIELFSWEGEDISPEKDRTLTRTVQREGEKYDSPNDNALLNVHIAGFYNDKKILDKDFEFYLGECSEQGLPDGVDKALKKFKRGEKSVIHMAPCWAYGSKGHEAYGIPPNAALDFEIELKNFTKAKESWEMDSEEKLVECEKLKAKGTEFFQRGKNKMAATKYKRIVDMLQYETTLAEEKKPRRDALYRAALLNLALVFLKAGENVEAVKHCDKVLEEDKSNVKALYRRAEAYQNQNDFELAISDYEGVISVEPENKAAKNQIVVCKRKITEVNQKQRKLYANMFEKLAKAESKEQTNGEAQTNTAVGEEDTVAETMEAADTAQA